MCRSALAALALLAFGAGPAHAATYSGTIQVSMTVQLKSTFPSGQKFLCGVSLNIYDPGAGGQGPYTAATVVKTASGSTLKCEVDIPYSWVLVSDGSSASASWSVTAGTSETGASRNIRGGLTGITPTKTGTTKLSVTGTM